MLEWIKSLFRKKARPEPRMIEHRGMKGYFSTEMIEMFESVGLDYEECFKASVDEVLDEAGGVTDILDGEENPYV